MTEKLTLTIKETADLLGISLPIAYQLARHSDFPTIRIGRKVLVSRLGLEKWIAEQASR